MLHTSGVNNLISFKEKSLIKTLLSDISNLKSDAYYIMLNASDSEIVPPRHHFESEEKSSASLSVKLTEKAELEQNLDKNETNHHHDSDDELFEQVKLEKELPNCISNIRNNYFETNEESNNYEEHNHLGKTDSNEEYKNNEEDKSVCAASNEESNIEMKQQASTSLSSLSPKAITTSTSTLTTTTTTTTKSHDLSLDNVRISKELIEELLVCLANENINPYTSNGKVNMSEKRNEIENENEKQINNQNIFQPSSSSNMPSSSEENSSSSCSKLNLNSINSNSINTNVNLKIENEKEENENEKEVGKEKNNNNISENLNNTQTTELNNTIATLNDENTSRCNPSLNCINYANDSGEMSEASCKSESLCKHLGNVENCEEDNKNKNEILTHNAITSKETSLEEKSTQSSTSEEERKRVSLNIEIRDTSPISASTPKSQRSDAMSPEETKTEGN